MIVSCQKSPKSCKSKFLEWSLIKKDLNYVTDFSTEVLHRFRGRIFSYEISDVFLDVGTPERYEKANNLKKLEI